MQIFIFTLVFLLHFVVVLKYTSFVVYVMGGFWQETGFTHR